MSDMRKLLESMTKFAGEPEQKPGDQVRGTERATKKKSGKHPFQGRLVGGESVIRELEQQLAEGDVERRLREEFEKFEDVEEAISLDTLRSAVGAKQEPDEFAAKLLARRQQQQAQAPREKVYRGPEEYRKEKEKAVAEEQVNELGANNPPQPNSAVTGTATAAQPGQPPAPVDPKDAAALKQSLAKLKTSVPGLDITKAATTMAKADTGTQLNPADKNIASAFAPDLANLMKNPQMASQLKMMIDKADQQEKAAAAKPAGTV